MAYKALYRTYRPNTFDEVVGQQHIVKTLQNAVHQNKVAHAYLFCGPRGTGKTTIAKLLAKAVNCEAKENRPCEQCANCLAIKNGSHPDVVEIDAASNNGVDEIRNIIEKVKYSPIQGKYKVYIIDEVHMLSTGAFNALLKTLEEPPAHVIFVLATTEPHKVLPTIISRCQRYDFTKVSSQEMTERLKDVLVHEGIEYEEEVLSLICTLADGGMRDALSILDQAIAYTNQKLTVDAINEIYGITTISEKISLIKSVFIKDVKTVLEKVRTYSESGIDIVRLTSDLIDLIKEIVIYSYTNEGSFLKKCDINQAEEILSYKRTHELLRSLDLLMETLEKYKNASNVVSYFEVCLLKMMTDTEETKVEIPSTTLSDSGIKAVQTVRPEIVTEFKPSNNIEETKELPIEKEKEESKSYVTEPIKKISEILETEEKKEVKQKPTIHQSVSRKETDLEFYLSLVVGANKNEKEADRKKWDDLGKKMNVLKYAKITNLLRNSNILASGKEFFILSADYQALANQIEDEMEGICDFCKNELNLDKRIFVITPDNFKKVTQMFLDRRNSNTLPEPFDFSKKEEPAGIEELQKEDGVLKKLEEIFGIENIEISEEDN